MGIFLAGWLLFSCSSDEPEVVEELKKANAKDFSFSLLSVNAKEVSVEKIKSILKSPTGWTIKSLKIDDESFAEVTGTSVKDFKIKIKKAGEFSFSVTLQKTGYEDFVLKGVKIKATFLANAKDFSFKLLELTGANEVSIETIKKNLKSPTGWTIKSLKIDDESFAEVEGASEKYFKIKIKKAGAFSFSITLQKTGYEDFILKGKIKVNASTAPPKKADPSKFGFPELPVNAKEVSFAVLRGNVRSPAGWTIKTIAVVDSDFGAVTGAGDSQKITIKKDGTFVINITLQKTGWEDFVLKGTIKASTPTQPPKKADPSNFSFPELPVNAKEIPIARIESNITKPAGWTIKTIAVVDSAFGTVTGTGSSQKIVLKKGGTFVINITLQKTGWVDYVLKGNIKAAFKADPSKFSFPLLPVTAKEVSFAVLRGNLTSPAGWTIKSITVVNSDFGAVTGSGSSQKIVLKKGGTFAINITLQKAGYEDFVLKGNIKAANLTADAKDFSFPELPVNAKEIPFATIESNLKKPAGWTIKSIKVADSDFGDVTGAGSSQKIVLKKGGTFAINITLQKTGWVDFVLKGNIKAANLKADAKDFSFPLLSVNAKEIPIAKIESNLTKPTGWTIKSIAVDDSSVAEKENQKIKIKAPTTYVPRTFTVSITLGGKIGWADYTLKGSIKADHSVFYLTFDKATKTITGVTDKAITTINIPDEIEGVAVTKIGDNAFNNLSKLTSLTIPDSVTVIGDGAFMKVTSLTSVTIPNSVTRIGKYAFYECTSLTTSITIPNSVIDIGEGAFINCTSLTSVTLPNKLTGIQMSTFANCASLVSVTIPISVTYIRMLAFSNCKKLVVTLKQPDASKIDISTRSFGGNASDMVKQIKVPSASLAAYKAASDWSAYKSIMTGY